MGVGGLFNSCFFSALVSSSSFNFCSLKTRCAGLFVCLVEHNEIYHHCGGKQGCLILVHCYFSDLFFLDNNKDLICHDTLMLRNNYGKDLARLLPPLVSCCNADSFVLSYLPQLRLIQVRKSLGAGRVAPGLGVKLGCNQLLPVNEQGCSSSASCSSSNGSCSGCEQTPRLLADTAGVSHNSPQFNRYSLTMTAVI